MSNPVTTNPTATTVDTDINAAVQAGETVAIAAAESAAVAAEPLLGAPVIKQVVDMLITAAVDFLGDKMNASFQEVGTFVVIDLQVSAEQAGISQALQNLMLAEKGGNSSAIQAAIQAYANAQSALVHDDGSSPAI